MVTKSEKDVFAQAVRNKGLNMGDFELIEKSGARRGVETRLSKGSVTITRISSGVERSYGVVHGSTWIKHFSDDLKSGLFD